MAEQAKPVLLARSDVARFLEVNGCIEAVEAAFRAHGLQAVPPPSVVGVHAAAGGFHIKAGLLGDDPQYFAAKLNANFMGNGGLGLPTIQGVILLCDAATGNLLAVMDSIEITAIRTAAATAVAAKYLARPDARVVTVCGCGTQGRAHLRALVQVRRLEEVLVYDVDRAAAEQLARELGRELDLSIRVVDSVDAAIHRSDICVTCTPSRIPFVDAGLVRPGSFVAGVGADNESKHELAPDLLAAALVVTDVTAQCAVMGDLHHALESGRLTLSGVHAELGEIVAGLKPGRTRPDQITLFDSTGMALQDVAAAALVYRRCRDSGHAALQFRFNS